MKLSLGDSIEALKPGPFFRRAVLLYADRKLFLLASFHIVITAVIISKFSRDVCCFAFFVGYNLHRVRHSAHFSNNISSHACSFSPSNILSSLRYWKIRRSKWKGAITRTISELESGSADIWVRYDACYSIPARSSSPHHVQAFDCKLVWFVSRPLDTF